MVKEEFIQLLILNDMKEEIAEKLWDEMPKMRASEKRTLYGITILKIVRPDWFSSTSVQ